MKRVSCRTFNGMREAFTRQSRSDLNVQPGLVGGGDESRTRVIRGLFSQHHVTTGFLRSKKGLASTYWPLEKKNFGGFSGVANKALRASKAELDHNTVAPLEFFHIRRPFAPKALRKEPYKRNAKKEFGAAT